MNRAHQGIARKVLPFPGVTVINPGPEGAYMPEAKVFTPVFLVRLAAINAAEREIRGLGYQVVWSKIAGPAPQIHIKRGDQSMAPMLNRLTNKVITDCDEGGYKTVRGSFMDCQVSWLEPL